MQLIRTKTINFTAMKINKEQEQEEDNDFDEVFKSENGEEVEMEQVDDRDYDHWVRLLSDSSNESIEKA